MDKQATQQLLEENGVSPDSPLGKIVAALGERIERLEAEVLPQDPPEVGLP